LLLEQRLARSQVGTGVGCPVPALGFSSKFMQRHQALPQVPVTRVLGPGGAACGRGQTGPKLNTTRPREPSVTARWPPLPCCPSTSCPDLTSEAPAGPRMDACTPRRRTRHPSRPRPGHVASHPALTNSPSRSRRQIRLRSAVTATRPATATCRWVGDGERTWPRPTGARRWRRLRHRTGPAVACSGAGALSESSSRSIVAWVDHLADGNAQPYHSRVAIGEQRNSSQSLRDGL